MIFKLYRYLYKCLQIPTNLIINFKNIPARIRNNVLGELFLGTVLFIIYSFFFRVYSIKVQYCVLEDNYIISTLKIECYSIISCQNNTNNIIYPESIFFKYTSLKC